jgi:hypothetical protein
VKRGETHSNGLLWERCRCDIQLILQQLAPYPTPPCTAPCMVSCVLHCDVDAFFCQVLYAVHVQRHACWGLRSARLQPWCWKHSCCPCVNPHCDTQLVHWTTSGGSAP